MRGSSAVRTGGLQIEVGRFITLTPSQQRTRSPQRSPARWALLLASIELITAWKKAPCRSDLTWLDPPLAPPAANVRPNPPRKPWPALDGSRRSLATWMLVLDPLPPLMAVPADPVDVFFFRSEQSTSSMMMRIASPKGTPSHSVEN